MNILKNKNFKRAIIFGYGSMGKKHFKILKDKNFRVKIITNQKINKKIKIDRSKIKNFDPSIIVIASKTSKHFHDLKFVDKLVKKKIIIIEKPLFENYKKIKLKNNKYFVGYNLRFHPIIQFLKKQKIKPYFVQATCFSYLPNWRKNIDYAKSNTAKKIGGGVALELSHEIDYLIWMFGSMKKINILNKKISNLKISKDDILILNSKIKNFYCNISINLFSKIEKRELYIYTKKNQYYADLLDNKLTILSGNKKKTLLWKNFKMAETYKILHDQISRNKTLDICTVKQANNLLKII